MNSRLDSIYQASQNFTKHHYENFPVISLSLPKEIRKHVAVIYQFARQADDLADEGDMSVENRTESLELYTELFQKCLDGKSKDDFWIALKNTIDEKRLDPQYLFDLLSAFKQDIVKNRYDDFPQLLDYCSRSANPVGRLILELFNLRDETVLKFSDSICTALQLTNFYQDISIDYQKNRIYIPLDEMQKFGVDEKTFDKKQNNANFKQLMEFQIERSFGMFTEGRKLLKYLPKSLLPQIKMTILGGEKILRKIVEMEFNVLSSRPKLNKLDYFRIFLQGIFTDAK